MPVAPLALAGPAGTALQVAQAVAAPAAMGAAALSYANRNKRQLLKADVNALKSGDPGIAYAQQRQTAQQAMAQQQALQAQQMAQLQQGLAAGTISGGQAAQIANAQQQAAGAALGANQQNIDMMSQQAGQAREAQTRARIDQKADSDFVRAAQFAQSLQGVPAPQGQQPDIASIEDNLKKQQLALEALKQQQLGAAP